MAADPPIAHDRAPADLSRSSRRRRDVVVLLAAAFVVVFLAVPGTPPVDWGYAVVWVVLAELVVVVITFLGPQWNTWERLCAAVAALGLPAVVFSVATWVDEMVHPLPDGSYTPASASVTMAVAAAVTLVALGVLTRPVGKAGDDGWARFRAKVTLAVVAFTAWTSLSAATGWPW